MSEPEPRAPKAARPKGSVAARLILAVVLAVAGAMGVWGLAGGRIYVMNTASMCPEICVGSAVVDQPLHGPLHVGELVTFHPPATPSNTYTHMVYKILPGGGVETKGLANGKPDAWVLHRADITGQVVFTVWGLGWLLKSIPVLGVGAACWAIGRGWVRAGSRRTWDRACMTAMLVLPIFTLHPLVRGAVLTNATPGTHRHWEHASIINTGILPAAFHAQGGSSVLHVGPGQLAVVSAFGNGSLFIHQTVSFYWWGWLLLGLVVASPLLGYGWHLWRGTELLAEPAEGTSENSATDRRAVSSARRRTGNRRLPAHGGLDRGSVTRLSQTGKPRHMAPRLRRRRSRLNGRSAGTSGANNAKAA